MRRDSTRLIFSPVLVRGETGDAAAGPQTAIRLGSESSENENGMDG